MEIAGHCFKNDTKVILINGAFGIGKTTIARRLLQKLPSSIIFDPELVGLVLQRGARLIGRPVEDFQDIRVWRRLCIMGVRLVSVFRRNVIVPMAFSNVDHLNEIRTGIARFEPNVFHFCLVAPVEVVNARIRQRGGDNLDRNLHWQYRRAAECCLIHGEPSFAQQITAADQTPEEIAEHILTRLASEL